MNKLQPITIQQLMKGANLSDIQELTNFFDDLYNLVNIQEGVGVPAYNALLGSNYLDTATNKFYRNADGGATWVALN